MQGQVDRWILMNGGRVYGWAQMIKKMGLRMCYGEVKVQRGVNTKGLEESEMEQYSAEERCMEGIAD